MLHFSHEFLQDWSLDHIQKYFKQKLSIKLIPHAWKSQTNLTFKG